MEHSSRQLSYQTVSWLILHDDQVPAIVIYSRNTQPINIIDYIIDKQDQDGMYHQCGLLSQRSMLAKRCHAVNDQCHACCHGLSLY